MHLKGSKNFIWKARVFYIKNWNFQVFVMKEDQSFWQAKILLNRTKINFKAQ